MKSTPRCDTLCQNHQKVAKKVRQRTLQFLFLALLAVNAWLFFDTSVSQHADSVSITPVVSSSNPAPVFAAAFLTAPGAPSAHSASIAKLTDNTLASVWYAGTREGASDVSIFYATYDLQSKAWSTPVVLFTPAKLTKANQYHVEKVGNPVIYKDSKGTIWVFTVGVSFGGWAMSSIYVSQSNDEGQTWTAPKPLKLSPFFNLSNLVRGGPYELADGTLALPIYHECLGVFGELAYLDPQGDVIGKKRLSAGRYSLQPELIPMTDKHVVSLMRDRNKPNRRVLWQESHNAGKTWTPLTKTDIYNPNAAVAAIKTGDNQILLAANYQEEHRHTLTLFSCDSQLNCTQIKELERGNLANAYSYPDITQDSSGAYHLVYTWNREKIKHVRFNQAWINKALGKP